MSSAFISLMVYAQEKGAKISSVFVFGFSFLFSQIDVRVCSWRAVYNLPQERGGIRNGILPSYWQRKCCCCSRRAAASLRARICNFFSIDRSPWRLRRREQDIPETKGISVKTVEFKKVVRFAVHRARRANSELENVFVCCSPRRQSRLSSKAATISSKTRTRNSKPLQRPKCRKSKFTPRVPRTRRRATSTRQFA